jgi:hypothetical protein
MRFKEIISEDNALVNADIDWDLFAAGMARQAIEQDLPRGLDAVMYLGIIGDPNRTTMEIRLDRPVKIGRDHSPNGQGYLSGTAVGQYFQSGLRYDKKGQPLPDEKDFDIILNFNGDPLSAWVKKDNMRGEWIGHELQHRGLQIIANIGPILDKIPERSKFVFQDGNRARKKIPSIGFDADALDTSKGDYRPTHDPNDSRLEHMLLYSLILGGPSSDKSDTSPDASARRERFAGQIQKYRQIYYDIEGAARAYILSSPVPPGSLVALRKELEASAPDGQKVVVGMGPDNKPTVKLVSVPTEPTPVANGASGKSVNGVVKKSAPPITVGGWTLSDD